MNAADAVHFRAPARLWTAIVLSCSVFISCAPRAPIVIGFAASLSGRDYMLGVEGRNAAELFVKTVNEAGGIKRRKLALEIRDLQSDDANAEAVTLELTQAGALVILGYYTSSAAVAALRVAPDKRVPLVSPSATSTTLCALDDGFFRTIMSSEQDVPYLVKHMKSRGIERVLFLATTGNAAYIDTYAIPLKTLLTVQDDLRFFSPAEIDYTSIARLRDRDPSTAYQAILIVASSIDTGTIAQELAIRGLTAPLYVSGWAGNDDLITYGGNAVEGAVFVHQTDPDHPGWAEIADLYRSTFNTKPGFSALQTWDALLFIQQALKTAENRPARLAEALRSVRSFTTPAGIIRMDEYGDARRKLYVKQVAGQKLIIQPQDD